MFVKSSRVGELYANTAFSHEQMTLVMKFINEQINKERNTIHGLLKNSPATANHFLLAFNENR